VTADPPGVVVPAGSPLRTALEELAAGARMVFLAGLPGTGKSLLLHQLAHLAHARGRDVSLLQWDVARPPFEAHPAGRRYPTEGGVTHGLIRLAVGGWARHALVRWDREHPAPAHLLLGELPLVGHRLIELARPAADAAEALLQAPGCRFVVPVPSAAVRRHLEGERERRAAAPRHEREREDAPPAVLRDLWRQLAGVAAKLGIAAGAGDYDPRVYAEVYRAVLRHRRPAVLPVEARLPAGELSPYDYRVPCEHLVPVPAEIERFLAQAEREAGAPEELARRIERWWAG
jgi:hypothetical protein